MVVTELGIVILFKPWQLWKARSGMILTLSPNITDDKDVHPSNKGEYEPFAVQFSALYSTLTKPVQSLNAHAPMLVTEFGMVILVMPLHPVNAYSGIDLTSSPITTDDNTVHP